MKFKNFNINRLIIVAYRLPYKFIRKNNSLKAVQNSGGLVSAILSLSQKITSSQTEKEYQKIIWVGKNDSHLENNKISSQNDFDLFPVFIPDNINEKFYGGFCNDMIWPLFHYFPDYTVFDNSYYKAYIKANQLVSEQLKAIIKPGDFIWIHDYHFFLLPNMIRNWAPWANIGFFLHIPFPSHEIFRIMPRIWREKILKGLIGADLIGFHTNDYARHFIKSVKHNLNYECPNNIIKTETRTAKTDAFPIGIDFEKFNNAYLLPRVIKEKNKLSKTLKNLKLIFSVDRLDYSKGLLDRLYAFEYFLEKYPIWHEIVIFNMVVVPSRDTIEKYKLMKKEIEATVGRINGKYSTLNWRPIIYQYKSLHFHELVALYEMSDVGFITPLRDGMNLVAKEYIACQHEKNGVLILSEMAGAADELKESIIINPNDKHETADALHKALTLKEKEKGNKIKQMQIRIKNYDVFTWANDFFTQFDEWKQEQDALETKLINKNILSEINLKYKSSEKRLFLLDYDGSLVPLCNNPDKAFINKKTFSIIEKLTNDTKNNVYIISGRNKNFLQKQFKKLNINLIAEHGYYAKGAGEDWKINADIDLSWKTEVRNLLIKYTKRCNGSQIEEKNSSIAWHYRNADQDNAKIRLIELKKELNFYLLNEYSLMLLEGNKVIEIKSSKYNKGTEIKKLLFNHNFDFILAIGDDKTDENIFEIQPENIISIKIGTEPTLAKYNINEQKEVIHFLEKIIE